MPRTGGSAGSGGGGGFGGFSIERPLWSAVFSFRLLAMVYAVARYADSARHYAHPLGGWAYMAVLAAWTLATLRFFTRAERSRWPILITDLAVTVVGIILTRFLDGPGWAASGDITMPTIFAGASILGFSVKGGWRPAALATVIISVADNIERGSLAIINLHNAIILLIAGCAIGYVVEVARASEATLARALRIEAATRERERLARDIHDSVLQVLAMVQRRGTEAGGEAAELGRMAGEQEAALRALIADGLSSPLDANPAIPQQATVGKLQPAAWGREELRDQPGTGQQESTVGKLQPAASWGRGELRDQPSTDPHAATGPRRWGLGRSPKGGRVGETPRTDLRSGLRGLANASVTVATPADPVLVPDAVGKELTAAVAAALDNVARHAGPEARAWILVEDEPDAVIVSVRDDGPGIPEGRLAEAAREGRLGVAQSIRGRVRDLRGTAEISSVPGEGTEVELRVPKEKGL